jgi:3-dehydroquinate dehydratase type I
VSILPRNITEALELIEKAELAHADFTEVRLDCLNADADFKVLTAKRRTPLLATDKAKRDASEHRHILTNAARSGFEYVDIDLSTLKIASLVSEVKASGAKCIVSFHDSSGTPTITKLGAILKRQRSKGADICKIVTTARKQEDNLILLYFLSRVSAQAKIVCFAMGELGKTSRLLSPIFGGYFTFASLDRGSETAPGQITLQDMRAAYEIIGKE